MQPELATTMSTLGRHKQWADSGRSLLNKLLRSVGVEAISLEVRVNRFTRRDR